MTKGNILIIIVGVVLLPFSPFLALAGMGLTAWLLSRPAQPKTISKRKRNKIIKESEQEHREKLASSTETVFFCQSCGAVYTVEFLNEFSIPDQPNTNKQDVSIQNPCYYCGGEISIAAHPQSHYEQQANADNVNVLGEHLFPKPLRFRSYVLQENAVNPNPILLREYLDYLEKQVFIHYVMHIQLVRRINPYADVGFEQLVPMMSYTMDLNEMCRKYDLIGKEKAADLDLLYPTISSSQDQDLLTT